ncbi:MAG: hypothetical protein A2445_04485 [Candidatus Jacksonbacteria bacterium RIFOXYC2_FULL_44_29]|nr:MAG: hypothetical protein UV19_C0003G0020 [Parcubacteria group bacterium GW2011_GWA2_42_28]KKT55839.1 MAG: hypothetical protein UW45_C0004G0020 [Parcubacteria group bacterium GW2011_GWC2_44_22]OGY75617.1 MAG: hypothetical protein A2240_03675 [Candidatus Jacksonbacteria bacterium RIFOXYA2_FULL_43_12]OGY76590.1 MAG: hypothetical protein A2295_01415 [Candidatus Jacksonbacteria bacterium RIFOXYB2_FULL_44_15]OGY78315.1 MAG: hypothetical protein A2445_04485 [Candidatus Jacksonbacteria bacterium RI
MISASKKPTELNIRAKVTTNGVDVIVNKEPYRIIYPKEVWQAFPQEHQEILKDNLAYSATLFLPQILQIKEINYQTARPLSEAFLFKNGINDAPTCAIADGRSSIQYVKDFYNIQPKFADERIKTPDSVKFQQSQQKKQTVIIPFSFGKESLLSLSLCEELGLRPILVNFIEPANDFEYFHKKRLMARFKKERQRSVYTIFYEPGIFRYGKRWGLQTDLGWGLQTTEYALMCLPFVHYFNADYILLGNEQSCNDIFFDSEGVLTYKAAYDQHHDWTPQQSLLASLMLGRKVEVISFMDPLYELAIVKILHNRYSANGRFQMSCMADNSRAKNNRWCQSCVKCGYIYALCAAFGFDLAGLGFTANLFDSAHAQIYDHFFHYNPQAPAYGSQEELGLAFYLAYQRGCQGYSIERFKKSLLRKIARQKDYLTKRYLGIQPTETIPLRLKDKVLNIFQEELREFIVNK